jgi:hypothetical protein
MLSCFASAFTGRFQTRHLDHPLVSREERQTEHFRGQNQEVVAKRLGKSA